MKTLGIGMFQCYKYGYMFQWCLIIQSSQSEIGMSSSVITCVICLNGANHSIKTLEMGTSSSYEYAQC